MRRASRAVERIPANADCAEGTPCCTAGRFAHWKDTPCLCDCHYPKVPASKMLTRTD